MLKKKPVKFYAKTLFRVNTVRMLKINDFKLQILFLGLFLGYRDNWINTSALNAENITSQTFDLIAFHYNFLLKQ